jgi:hypothetical protein
MQVMRILLAIRPNAPRHLLVHCLVHDIGEMVTGDPPYPVKKNNPGLKAECDRIERDAHLAMCHPWSFPPPQRLTEHEHALFKVAEFLEMWEWGIHEVGLGNHYAELVTQRCEEAVHSFLAREEEGLTRDAIINYMSRRANHERRSIVPPPPAPHPSGGAGRGGGDAQGPQLPGQLEEAGGCGGLHDAGPEVGPAGEHAGRE